MVIPQRFRILQLALFKRGEYSFFFQALDQVNAPAGGGVTTFHVISKPTISANTPAADATVVPNAAAVISVTIDDPDNSMATYTGTGLNPIIFVAPQGHGVQAKELTQVGSTNEYTATVDLSEEVLTNVEIAVRTGAADAVTINYSFTVSSATGLSTVNNNYFQFGPNPATDYLNFNSSNIKKVEFYNLTGALVKTEQENVDINISELSEGVYILHIYDKQGNVYTDRFLKQ
jgi:hypothetical protein